MNGLIFPASTGGAVPVRRQEAGTRSFGSQAQLALKYTYSSIATTRFLAFSSVVPYPRESCAPPILPFTSPPQIGIYCYV